MGMLIDYAAKMRQQQTPFNGGLQQYLDDEKKKKSMTASPENFYGYTPQVRMPLPGAPTQAEQQPSEPQNTEIDTTDALGSLVNMLETPAEREARERRMLEHKNKMQGWLGLFDGLRQLGGLYLTAKGASPMNLTSPAQAVDQQYQQYRQLYNDMANYRQNYASQLYNLHRQQQADKRAAEEHNAKLDWYKNRDEQNAEKVAIQRLKAENDAAYKEATLEEKKRMNDIMADVYAGRISLMEAQEQLAKVRAAHVGAGGSGRGGRNGSYTKERWTDEQGHTWEKRVDGNGNVTTHQVKKGVAAFSQNQQPQKRGSLLPK